MGRVRNLYVLGDLIIAIGDRAIWEVCSAHITKTKVLVFIIFMIEINKHQYSKETKQLLYLYFIFI